MWPTLCFVHCFMGNSFSATVEFIPRSRWEVALLYKNTIYEGTDPNAHILCVRHRPMRTNGAVSIFFRHMTMICVLLFQPPRNKRLHGVML